MFGAETDYSKSDEAELFKPYHQSQVWVYVSVHVGFCVYASVCLHNNASVCVCAFFT